MVDWRTVLLGMPVSLGTKLSFLLDLFKRIKKIANGNKRLKLMLSYFPIL